MHKYPQIIGITGRKYSGKDTLGELLVSKYGYERIAHADALKDGMKLIFGFSKEQVYGNKKEEIDEFWQTSPREILQFFGTEVFRDGIKPILPNIGDNFWVNVLQRKMQNTLKENPNARFVITDVRFSNEIDAIKKMNGVTIKLTRNTQDNAYSNHASEKEIDLLDTNYNIENNSTIDNLTHVLESIMQQQSV